MNSMDFHNPPKGMVVSISQETIGKIKKLKSHISKESGYTPDGIMLQWRYSDNEDIIKESDIDDIQTAMQFISMTAIMSDEFKQKHNVEPHHESLLRRLYLDVDGDDSGELITTAFKRPFGNSHVSGDVAEEMAAAGLEPYIDEDEGELDEPLVTSEYIKFIGILDAFMKDFELPYHHFESATNTTFGVTNRYSDENLNEWIKRLPHLNDRRLHSYLWGWKLCKSELRDKAISQILNEE